MKAIKISLLSVLLCLSSLGVELKAQVLASDSLALVALYNSTNGANWTNKTNWLTGPVSSWFGITVISGRVVQVILGDIDNNPPQIGNNLVGTIPAALGNLTNLQFMSLAGNTLSGGIPKELGNLNKIEYLYLYANKLTGNIPTELGNLSNIIYLYLDDNQLTGPIPATFGNLPKIQILSLRQNKLNGSIPTVLGNLVTLQNLWLFNNELTGTIPISLGNLTNLRELQLQTNQLSGPVPVELANLTSLRWLVLSNNTLTGTIPPQLGNLTNLISLELAINEMTGSIPKELGNLKALQFLILYTNKFDGSIPEELKNLTNLIAINLSTNQLTGTVPAEMGLLPNLQTLALSDNQLTGAIPSEFKILNKLKLLLIEKNQFTDLPDFSKSTMLTTAWLRDNFFQFDDLEPNISITNLNYSPQGKVAGGGARSLSAGQSFDINFTVGGSANQYQWKKNGSNISGATNPSFSIPAVAESDAGTYVLFITSALVSGLTLQSEPIVLSINGGPQAVIEVKESGTPKPSGDNVAFSTTGIGSEQLKKIEITNTGNITLVISDIQVTGDFSLESAIPATIDAGESSTLSLRFAPTALGQRTGILSILSNGNVPVFTINLLGNGEVEPIVYNVVTANKNGKHDFLKIENIIYFPENKVSIFDRWGNKVFERDSYDNAQNVFTGLSDNNKELPDGTYFYVIDKNNGDKPLNGFIYLRR